MNEIILAGVSCLAAGILTTTHPCPLTTNIASFSFLAGMTTNRRQMGLVVFYFVCGYLISYLFLGISVSSGLFTIPFLSAKLQINISLFLGPALILLGMLQADFFSLQKFYKGRIIKYLQAKRWTGIRALPFGMLIALSFCPATAAIFFGVLIPLAVRYKQMLLFPAIYAIGATLPVITVSMLISQGSVLTGKKGWISSLPKVSGYILIIIGIYLSIRKIYL